MKLVGALPVPSLTATLLEPIGRAPRLVVIIGDPGWKRRLANPPTGGVHICQACGGIGHHRGSQHCPERDSLAATKALLKARRK